MNKLDITILCVLLLVFGVWAGMKIMKPRGHASIPKGEQWDTVTQIVSTVGTEWRLAGISGAVLIDTTKHKTDTIIVGDSVLRRVLGRSYLVSTENGCIVYRLIDGKDTTVTKVETWGTK